MFENNSWKNVWFEIFLGELGDADEDESDDENSEVDVDYSWKKAIMIGSSYQASVPVEISTEQDDDSVDEGIPHNLSLH